MRKEKESPSEIALCREDRAALALQNESFLIALCGAARPDGANNNGSRMHHMADVKREGTQERRKRRRSRVHSPSPLDAQTAAAPCMLN